MDATLFAHPKFYSKPLIVHFRIIRTSGTWKMTWGPEKFELTRSYITCSDNQGLLEIRMCSMASTGQIYDERRGQKPTK